MRLVELELQAYGGFSGVRLDFSRRDALHVVCGSNEAGKSTTLRAVHALLYGIDSRTSDAYRHAYADLRIAARVQRVDGSELCFVRRKGNKGTLLTPAGQELSDAALTPFLCGVTRSMFEAMFGLDHERLRSGGEQLRSGQGDVGESLFQAGAGAASIQRVLGSLRAEAEAIFAPRAKRPLNEAIDAFEAARKRVREEAVRADVVTAQEEKLAKLEQEVAALAERRRLLGAEESRLRRALHVLPELAKRARYVAEREALGDVPELPADAESRRVGLSQLQAESTRELARLTEREARLREEQGRLRIVASLERESAQSMRALAESLAVHRKAAVDRPKRQAQLGALEQALTTALRALPGAVSRDEVDRLVLDGATLARIGKLGRERGGLEARSEQAQRERDEARVLADRARSVAIGMLHDAALALDGLDARMPSEETIVDYATRFERLERAAERFEREREALDQRARRLTTQLDTLARTDAPPTDEELSRARAERDASVRGLRQAATAGEPSQVVVVDALGQQVAHADQLGDRMRREASRIAERAQWLAEQGVLERERAALEARVAEHAASATETQRTWLAAWSLARLVPGTPAEMRARRNRVLEALAADERRKAAQRVCDAAEAALARWQDAWTPLMAKLGLPPAASGEEAQAVVDARREVQVRVTEGDALRGRIEGMDRDSAALRADAEALIARHAPELASLPMEDAVDELVRLHARTLEDSGHGARIDRELSDLHAQADEARARQTEAALGLQLLMQLAGTTSLEVLVRHEQRARRARELSALIAGCEEDLEAHGDGASLARLEAEVRGLDPDTVRARLSELESELEQLHEDQPALLQEKLTVQGGLQRFQLGGAADAAAEVEHQLTRVRGLAVDFARKRLAAEVLERAIMRYREANQGPVLKRAEALFRELTRGAYPRLQVAYGQADEPVLQCVQVGERTVDVEHLSEGTLDQLYLALRLASLERFAQSAEPLPLLLDDVLVNFDEDRATAAFGVLGELSEQMQVLFFTHHAHHLELARAALGADRVVEHRLSRTPAGSELRP